MCANSFILVLLDFVWYCYFNYLQFHFLSLSIRSLYVTFGEVCFLLMLIEWSREVAVSVWNFCQLYFSLYCCLTVFSVFYVWLSIYFLMYINGLFFDTLIYLYALFLLFFFFFLLSSFMFESMYVWQFVKLKTNKLLNMYVWKRLYSFFINVWVIVWYKLFEVCKLICIQTCLQNIMFENKLFCDFSCLFQLFNVSLHQN